VHLLPLNKFQMQFRNNLRIMSIKIRESLKVLQKHRTFHEWSRFKETKKKKAGHTLNSGFNADFRITTCSNSAFGPLSHNASNACREGTWLIHSFSCSSMSITNNLKKSFREILSIHRIEAKESDSDKSGTRSWNHLRMCAFDAAFVKGSLPTSKVPR